MRKLLLISLLTTLPLLSACAPVVLIAAAGGTAIYWINGEAESSVAHDMDTSWKACKKAFDALNVTTTKEEPADALQRRLEGTSPGGDKYIIRLKSISSKTTKIRVRVNFRDKEKSARIHEEIRNNLP